MSMAQEGEERKIARKKSPRRGERRTLPADHRRRLAIRDAGLDEKRSERMFLSSTIKNLVYY
jgi:hypothetical protein